MTTPGVDWRTQAYNTLHRWLHYVAGPAKEHLCVSCLGPAEDWSNISGEYRRDVTDFVPMCKLCHGWFDSKDRVSPRRAKQCREAMRRSRARKKAR